MEPFYRYYLTEEANERLLEITEYLEDEMDIVLDPSRVLSTIVMQVVLYEKIA